MNATVVTTGEVRDQLSKIAASFDAGKVEPVVFGSHRRPQAVIVPFSLWQRLVEQLEDEIDLELARKRLAKGGLRISHAEVLRRLAKTQSSEGESAE
ncbi:MAG: hypothetical protein DLM55_03715 [Acidimicrobiales bacterium]|nr:MAG: hypothetical protein DLM55_03715 [Acidimicrobiales bacterium]